MIDSTIIKIHQNANGLKKASEAKGRSGDGLTAKIYAVCDGYGNPLKFMLTARNVNDSIVAEEMLS